MECIHIIGYSYVALKITYQGELYTETKLARGLCLPRLQPLLGRIYFSEWFRHPPGMDASAIAHGLQTAAKHKYKSHFCASTRHA